MTDPRITGAGATTNEQLLDRAIRHAVFVSRFRSSVGNELVADLDDLLARVLSKVDSTTSRIASRGFAVNSATRKQLRDAITEIARDSGRTYAELRRSLAAKMREFAKAEAQFQVAAFRDTLPKGITLGFTTPAAPELNSILTKRPLLLNGRSGFMAEFFDRMPRNLTRDVEAAVNTGLAAGETPAEIMRRLSGFKSRPGVGGVFGKTRRDLMTVTRSTVNHVSNQAREMTYAANDDLVKSVKFVATLDARTTPICRSLDGEVFPVNEGDRPPMHHQCRSTTVPVLASFEELGLGDLFQEAGPEVRASLDGEVPADLTYTDWLRQQPRSVQDMALGPTRAGLFREGQIDSMKDLVGPLNRPLTLDQLRAAEGL